nr:hypothetical protein [Pedobacter panaciterrae]
MAIQILMQALCEKFDGLIHNFYRTSLKKDAFTEKHFLPFNPVQEHDVGFRNKVKSAFSWFWSFARNDRTLRLIIRCEKERK